MGATKKTKPKVGGKKKKPVKKKAAEVVNMDVSTFLDVAEQFQVVCEAFDTEIGRESTVGVFTQSRLSIALLLERIKKIAEGTYKNFRDGALAHYELSGEFEHGAIAITFPQKTSRSPKWKQETIDRAREIALTEGSEFDETAFVTEVQDSYPATTSTSVKLTKSA